MSGVLDNFVCYRSKRFSPEHEAVIAQANLIIGEFAAQGFSLTLRQLYYQFVARDLIPNTQQAYKRIGSIVSDARLAGLISWTAIEDRTRFVREVSHFDDPEDLMAAAARSYAVDRWEGQPERAEVWIEKDALVGIAEPTCRDWDVPLFSCRGYVSQSEMWVASQRMIRRGFPTTVIHLGDHDPSGIDMTRDIQDRLDQFESDARVDRVALNGDQIDEHKPPPNPAKVTDSRARDYIHNYGTDSWELDALDPATLARTIQDAILAHIQDRALFDRVAARQENERRQVETCADRWAEVIDFLDCDGR